jgi:hypothetical protein
MPLRVLILFLALLFTENVFPEEEKVDDLSDLPDHIRYSFKPEIFLVLTEDLRKKILESKDIHDKLKKISDKDSKIDVRQLTALANYCISIYRLLENVSDLAVYQIKLDRIMEGTKSSMDHLDKSQRKIAIQGIDAASYDIHLLNFSMMKERYPSFIKLLNEKKEELQKYEKSFKNKSAKQFTKELISVVSSVNQELKGQLEIRETMFDMMKEIMEKSRKSSKEK